MPKDQSIEKLRGLAILLVLALHSVNSEQASWGFRHFTFSLGYVYMPLFTAISGYVYGFRTIREGEGLEFLRKKAVRLLLPFMSVSTLQYAVVSVTHGTSAFQALSEVWRIYLLGYAHFWFLQVLAIIFIVLVIVETVASLADFRVFIGVLAVCSASNLLTPLLNIEIIDGVFYLLPYFFWGYGIHRYADIFCARGSLIAAGVITVVGLLLQQLVFFDVLVMRIDARSPLALIVAFSMTLLLFQVRDYLNVKGLSIAGMHAYPIYLFHGFGIAIGERLARLIPIDGVYTHVFLIKMIAGVMVAMAMETVLVKNRWLRKIFLGKQ